MALGLGTEKRAVLLQRIVFLLVLAVLLDPASPEPASTGSPSSSQSPTPAPQPKEKRSQEDIMFGNQQNKPASGMVDDFFQPSEAASKNSTQKSSTVEKASESPTSKSNSGSAPSTEHRQTLSELPDRLDYYDYVQPESSDQTGGSAPVEEDDMEEEDTERNSFFSQQDPSSSYGAQKLLASPPQIDRNELGDYPVAEEEYEGSSPSSLMYSRRKRGVFRRLRSPLEDLLSPSGGPFRRRRASNMRFKRDATSNELLSWLALLHRSQMANARKGNRDEIAFQELQGMEPEPLELSGDPGYLFEPLTDEEDLDDEDVLPASLLDPLPLPEEGPDGDPLDWDISVRAPPRRRSSAFYPVDYRYVLLPGTRKRSSLMPAPPGRFGSMREVNRWSTGEPQSGRWGHFPLFQQQQPRLGLPVAVRRAPQESDAERLYALASLLATPGATSRDFVDADSEQDRRRRRRSPKHAPLRG